MTTLLLRRIFSSGRILGGYNFDTLKFVKRLENEGFTPLQSKTVMLALSEVIEESMATLKRSFVTKEEQDKTTYTQKVDFAKLRSDLQTLEKTEFNLTKTEYDRLSSDLEKLRQKFREEITKTQANVRLDLNLEKGRIRDESSVHELKIKETDTRIETEMHNLRMQLEQMKTQVLQWLFGKDFNLQRK
ncbi:Protein FMP32, mitochondrial [Neolecta irregularis DAH-3]|uniref:Protein FMP32, mitochondrial n=1 Tax=Neolecta irregularis (strain DAH-3) TaxID=1198029 RepID=A0A1U7LMH7_NEOID|nr:Protein FMP32, mitochondrial [Neolecta irregularis DAH-3]|eukprot:OLL23870.1 Protein FMP32, mitochondrial [Neolecta irregularis DAH-3]